MEMLKMSFGSRQVPILAALETHFHQQLLAYNMNGGKTHIKDAHKYKSHFQSESSYKKM